MSGSMTRRSFVLAVCALSTVGVFGVAPDADAEGLSKGSAGRLPSLAKSTVLPSTPAQVLDLRNWSLDLPVDSTGGTAGPAATITQPALSTFALAPYFVVDAAGPGVDFEADCGGATTKSSSYPRSELREMCNGGTTSAAFSLTSGTHVMTIEGCILSLPPAKPQTVFGQLHDGGQDIIELMADGEKRGTAPNSIVLCYRFLGSTQPAHLDDSYVLGTPYTVEITVSGGYIRIFYNGRLVDRKKHSETGCYFKAGNYTQSNVGQGDSPSAYAQTRIYQLVTSHSPMSSVNPSSAVTSCGSGSGYIG
jgi:hypothetical protein